MIALNVVGLSLSKFDEFAVGLTSVGPMGREMVSVEFVQSQMMSGRAHDDACAAFLTGFDGV